MTNFVYDNVALPADKLDSGGGSSALASPTRQWSAYDSNQVFQALRDLRTVLDDQLVRAAPGDGVTDETARIQALIDDAEGEASTVYLPTGQHLISDTISIPSKVVLSGIGRNDVGKLKASASFPTDGRPLVRLGRPGDSLVFGARVENIILDCNSRAKVGVFSSAANEQSGVRFCVVTNFTQYGIHWNGASGPFVEDTEVYPQAAGATTGIFVDNTALDNLVKRVTIGVNGLLTNGLHVRASQVLVTGLHIENCTVGVNLDTNSSTVLIGVNGSGVLANVPDLIIDQGNNHHIGIGLIKNAATRLLTSNFGGYVNSDPFMPLWVGGDAILGGATHLPHEIFPPQITANQNNYSPATFASTQILYLTSDAARDITGFAAPNAGRVIWVYNEGTQNITLKHQSASSTAANRIVGRSGADTVLTPNTGVQLRYSIGRTRWYVLGDTL